MIRANDPGKYNDATTEARRLTGGDVILIVRDGKLGNGFSVQARIETLAILPAILRNVADEIERQLLEGSA